MTSTCCSCRTSALRTFVRSVAQIHLPNDNLVKAAAWHQTRRQLHQRGPARWPGVGSLPYRTTRSYAKAPESSALENEASQERELTPQGNPSIATDQAQPDAVYGDSAASHDLIKEEEKLFKATRKLKAAKKDQKGVVTLPEAKTASFTDSQAQAAPQAYDEEIYDETMEDPDMETFSVAEVEAKERERELNRLRIRAERAKVKEQEKKEQQRQKEQDKRQREKEWLKARPDWAAQKAALKEKFPEGWRPRKKLSPDALNGIRALNQQFPDTYTTEVLANKFEMSPEAIRRILRSKWEATPEEEEERERRWHNRGVNIWQHYAAIGKKPPAKWREAGVVVQPRRGRDQNRDRDRDIPERSSYDRYDGSSRGDEDMEVEQRRRFKRQQKLAKHLL